MALRNARQRNQDRVIAAARKAEQMSRSNDPLLGSFLPPPGGTSPTVVRITDVAITDPTPPDSGDPDVTSLSEEGFSPGVVTWYDPENDGTDEWIEDPDNECLVVSMNDEVLEVDKRYEGFTVGVRNGKAVVVVTVGVEGNSPSNPTCCGWIYGIRSTDYLLLTKVSAIGACNCGDAFVGKKLKYSAGAWYPMGTGSITLVTVCGVDYTVFFDFNGTDGTPRIVLTSTTGSPPVSYIGRLDCCGDGYATFVFAQEALCTGTPIPCHNTLVLKIQCDCAPFDNFAGPGWYCLDSGSGCEVIEIVGDGDECIGWTYCSGPYATELAAAARCAPVTSGAPDCISAVAQSIGSIIASRHTVSGTGGVGFDTFYKFTVNPSTTYHVDVSAYRDALTGVGQSCSSSIRIEGVGTTTLFDSTPFTGSDTFDGCIEFTTASDQTEVCIDIFIQGMCGSEVCSCAIGVAFELNGGPC